MNAIDVIQGCQGFIDDVESQLNVIAKGDDKAKFDAYNDYLKSIGLPEVTIYAAAQAFFLGNKNAIDQIKKQLDVMAAQAQADVEG